MYKRQALDTDLVELRGRAGLSVIAKNRPPNTLGVSHGGVALVFNESKCSFVEVPVVNGEDWEVVVGCGRFIGFGRPVLVVGCYLPTGYTVPRATSGLAFVRDVVTDLKRKYSDPYIVVMGDFNQWDIGGALIDFPDLKESAVGPMRGARTIDRIFSNLTDHAVGCGTVPPLEPDLCLLYTSPSPRD